MILNDVVQIVETNIYNLYLQGLRVASNVHVEVKNEEHIEM